MHEEDTGYLVGRPSEAKAEQKQEKKELLTLCVISLSSCASLTLIGLSMRHK
jgi:hypothetical protein